MYNIKSANVSRQPRRWSLKTKTARAPVLCTELEQVLSVHGCYTPSTTAPRLSGSETRSHLSQMADRPRPGHSTTWNECSGDHGYTASLLYLTDDDEN